MKRQETGTIYLGDSREVLKTMPPRSVDLIVTSPPYWQLRNYNTGYWEGGNPKCKHKKLKTTKNLYLPSYASKELINCPDCGAKRIDKQIGLESEIKSYINNLCDVFDECKKILKDSGSAWVNLGDSYKNNKKGNKFIPEKSLSLIPSRFAIEMVNRGWCLRNEIIWHKKNAMPHSVRDRFTVDYEKFFFFVKNPQKYYFKQQFEPAICSDPRPGGWERGRAYKYQGKYNQDNNVKEILKPKKKIRNKRTVWSINTKPSKEKHWASYPAELTRIPIEACSKKGQVVMDPFLGSGTTAVSAINMQRKFIGIELNKEYCKIAQERIKRESEQIKLF